MNQQALADALDLTFQQVQKYEHGANRVSASRLAAMAKILAVPISYFFADLQSVGAKLASRTRRGASSCPVMTVRRRGVKPGIDISESGAEPGQIGFLGQVLDRRPRLSEAFSGIGLYQSGGNAQQGRFAGAVAAHKTDPVAGRDG